MTDADTDGKPLLQIVDDSFRQLEYVWENILQAYIETVESLVIDQVQKLCTSIHKNMTSK